MAQVEHGFLRSIQGALSGHQILCSVLRVREKNYILLRWEYLSKIKIITPDLIKKESMD